MDAELTRIQKIIPIIDEQLGKTACLAKWHHTTIYLQTGQTHSCYHPPPHDIPLSELRNNPSALHNTQEKKLQRLEMINGKKPKGCNYCWNLEELGHDIISDRKERNASIYTKERIQEIADNDWDFDINPEYIEISFSNECNFKCGYCHPKASSRFWNEIKKFGPYEKSSDHRQDIDWFTIYQKEDDNPYVNAWWKWWPTVSNTLTILRITGGEPLMHKSTWELFERLDKDPKPHIQIELNSNLGVKSNLVEKLVNTVNDLIKKNKIKSFKLYTSIDTWSNRAEYIRFGLDISLWEKNLKLYLDQTSLPITLMITFNLFSVSSFDSLLNKILDWRREFNFSEKQRIRFDTPHLKEPSIFDINILPKEDYMYYMEKNLSFIKNNMGNQKFSSLEYEKFKRIVEHMKSSVIDQPTLSIHRKNFHQWFTEHDRRRNIDRYSIFPEMKDFFNLCKVENEKL